MSVLNGMALHCHIVLFKKKGKEDLLKINTNLVKIVERWMSFSRGVARNRMLPIRCGLFRMCVRGFHHLEKAFAYPPCIFIISASLVAAAAASFFLSFSLSLSRVHQKLAPLDDSLASVHAGRIQLVSHLKRGHEVVECSTKRSHSKLLNVYSILFFSWPPVFLNEIDRRQQ